MYGYMVEVSDIPTGLAVGCTTHYPASKGDIDVMRDSMERLMTELKNMPDELMLDDFGSSSSTYLRLWEPLFWLGLSRGIDILRDVLLKRKPQNGMLTPEDEEYNRKVSADHIIVKSHFGILCTLWAVLDTKWRRYGGLYGNKFKLYLALTNLHIRHQLL